MGRSPLSPYFLLYLPSSLQSNLGSQIIFIHFISWPILKGIWERGKKEKNFCYPREYSLQSIKSLQQAMNVGELWKNKSEESF